MRALWQRFGKTPAPQPGVVAKPYTLRDLRETLAVVSGDRAFADTFFEKYIEGREIVDYAPLFARAGYVLRPAAPSEATMGMVSLEVGQAGARVTALVPPGSPAAKAGLEMDAVIHAIDDRRIGSAEDMRAALASKAPGSTRRVHYTLRGVEQTRDLVTVANPRLELVSFERAGRPVHARHPDLPRPLAAVTVRGNGRRRFRPFPPVSGANWGQTPIRVRPLTTSRQLAIATANRGIGVRPQFAGVAAMEPVVTLRP